MTEVEGSTYSLEQYVNKVATALIVSVGHIA